MPLPTAAQLTEMANKVKADETTLLTKYRAQAAKAKPQMRARLAKEATAKIEANPRGGVAFVLDLYKPMTERTDLDMGTPAYREACIKGRAYGEAWAEVVSAFAKSQKAKGYTIRMWSNNPAGPSFPALDEVSVIIRWVVKR